MPPIKPNLDGIVFALDDHSGMLDHYYDRKTGEVILVQTDSQDEDEDLLRRIEAQPMRYLRIEPLFANEGFAVMEAFVETLPEGRDRQTLEYALRTRKPFRSFKSALRGWQVLSAAWFEFHDQIYKAKAAHWLAHSIPPEPKKPNKSSQRLTAENTKLSK